tara:strand:+ start:555 stop:683 length:129 start_codon:yes stop_codon:yes gene_type:complete
MGGGNPYNGGHPVQQQHYQQQPQYGDPRVAQQMPPPQHGGVQ